MGIFRMKTGQRWLPFMADQSFSTDPPAFVWKARIQFLPLVNLSVTNRFVNGRGRLQAKLLSLLSVADAKCPEVDQGELLRFLAETAWFPTAWLSHYLEWESVDAHTAKVTMRISGLAVSAARHFDDESRLCSVTAQRYIIETGRFLLRDWQGCTATIAGLPACSFRRQRASRGAWSTPISSIFAATSPKSNTTWNRHFRSNRCVRGRASTPG